MTTDRRRSSRPATVPAPPKPPGVHRLYSVGLGLLSSGEITVIVGKMDTATRRYRFATPAENGFEWPLDVSLHDMLVIASGDIAEDPELSHW